MKKPPGETAAVGVGAGAAAAPATVTPVWTASDAGIEERPGVNDGLKEVKTGAAPIPPPISKAEMAAAGGAPPPHQQPGGAFIHWVTTAVATFVQGDTAVTVT